jgi:hypothetical protein
LNFRTKVRGFKPFSETNKYLNPKELSRIDTIRASILMSLQLLVVSALSFVCLREIISGDINIYIC